MKYLILLMLLLVSEIALAQKKDRRDGVYSAYLYSVEGPKNLSDYSLDSTTSTWEDPVIKIDWDYAGTQIGFELHNKADQTIKILWDDAAYISIDNESGRVFHKGVKYIDRENSQPPTSVYKNTTISDLISPTSYTRYVPGQYGGWSSSSLIPSARSGLAWKTEYDQGLIGKTMRVVLPIKIGEELIEYIFSFRTTFVEKKK